MNDVKHWLASKTVWGGIIVVAATIAGFLGFTVDEADKTTLLGYVDQIVVIGGGLLAIFGRIYASKKIGS